MQHLSDPKLVAVTPKSMNTPKFVTVTLFLGFTADLKKESKVL